MLGKLRLKVIRYILILFHLNVDPEPTLPLSVTAGLRLTVEA